MQNRPAPAYWALLVVIEGAVLALLQWDEVRSAWVASLAANSVVLLPAAALHLASATG